MLSRWARTWHTKFWAPILALLIRWRVTPNQLTVAGVLTALPGGFAIAAGNPVLGAFFYLLANLFDSLDGELARAAGQESKLGPFLDSICDHLGDLAIYLGLIWLALGQGNRVLVMLTALAMFGSLYGSHVRSRAGMLGVDTRWSGAFTRLERMLVLVTGLLSGQLTLALGLLALMANFSAAQRIWVTVRALQK